MKLRLSLRTFLFVSLIENSLSQDCQAWRNFNISVKGRLYRSTPLALPCFSIYNGQPTEVDEEMCSTIRLNYTTAQFRVEEPSAYMNLQSELCWSDPTDQCVLDNTASPVPKPQPGLSCNQGSVPSYHVEVEEASDIAFAFAFAKAHGVPLVVKNSGHDYMTRSSQKRSLALWVHKLNGIRFHEGFVLEACSQNMSAGRAVTAGTGASSGDVIAFASEHRSTFIGGYSPTVAVSGGWVLGAGHSVLSPVYGLGVDRVVQYKIVTPDGVVRVANKCQHADLFWALRGGGGGTFGVVLEATHRLEPSISVAVANITLPSNITADTSMKWIELMARESLSWGKQGWGGHAAGLYLTYMNPLPAIANHSDGGSTAQRSMEKATEFALSIGGTSIVEILPDFIDVWNKYVVPGSPRTAGQVRVLSSRLLPQILFETDEGIGKLMNFIAAARDLGFDPRRFYCPVDTPFVADTVADHESSGTSVHPAWYHSLWSMANSISIYWNASYADRLQNLTALAKVTMLAEELTGTEGGTYPNEANPFTQNWRESWWGDNYPRLLEIKQKFDPDRLLECWKCVGFEDTGLDNEMFRCQAKLQIDIDKQVSQKASPKGGF
ncbi:hypothetical protein F5X99DRAFT_412209 [Biscogniauxia marginata]|nr:hypothetical protein F5X99DRAFT_412209 [Biscogniauxia marginata]